MCSVALIKREASFFIVVNLCNKAVVSFTFTLMKLFWQFTLDYFLFAFFPSRFQKPLQILIAVNNINKIKSYCTSIQHLATSRHFKICSILHIQPLNFFNSPVGKYHFNILIAKKFKSKVDILFGLIRNCRCVDIYENDIKFYKIWLNKKTERKKRIRK